MKYKKIITLTLIATIILSGCSIIENANGKEGSEEVEETVTDMYADLVSEIFDESNIILNEFNNIMDYLYARTASEEQFAKVVSDMLPKSNDLIKKLDDALYIIDDEMYDFHRDLITLVNFQHQMLLESIRAAKDPEMELDLNKLRNDYVTIKTDQTVLVQRVKDIIRTQLTPEEEE